MTVRDPQKYLGRVMSLVTVVSLAMTSGLASADPPMLSGLILEPATLMVGTGQQTVTISVQVFDPDDDLDPEKIKVKKIRSGKKNTTLTKLVDNGTDGDVLADDGRFTGTFELGTKTAKQVLLRLKAKDMMNNKAQPLSAIVTIEALAPMIQFDQPWIGNWVLIDFLTTDDVGVTADTVQVDAEPESIGFEAIITDTAWIEIDDFGCTLTGTYSVDGNNRHEKRGQSVSAECPPGIEASIEFDSGHLEFSSDAMVMIEHFDVPPGADPDDLVLAFVWQRK